MNFLRGQHKFCSFWSCPFVRLRIQWTGPPHTHNHTHKHTQTHTLAYIILDSSSVFSSGSFDVIRGSRRWLVIAGQENKAFAAQVATLGQRKR